MSSNNNLDAFDSSFVIILNIADSRTGHIADYYNELKTVSSRKGVTIDLEDDFVNESKRFKSSVMTHRDPPLIEEYMSWLDYELKKVKKMCAAFE